MSKSPKILTSAYSLSVIILTLITVFGIAGCTWVSHKTYEYISEECNSRAYIDNKLPDFITQRYGKKSQVRLGIIPFTVPANFTGWGNGKPDWAYELAVMTHQELLSTAEIPVVEVLDRRDWPGKSEEFFAGNFGAIHSARDAGFDLVMVGMLEPIRSANGLAVVSKVIDTESGITAWYGRIEVVTYRPDIEKSAAYINLSTRRPDLVYTPDMAKEMAACMAESMTKYPEEEKSCFWPFC